MIPGENRDGSVSKNLRGIRAIDFEPEHIQICVYCVDIKRDFRIIVYVAVIGIIQHDDRIDGIDRDGYRFGSRVSSRVIRVEIDHVGPLGHGDGAVGGYLGGIQAIDLVPDSVEVCIGCMDI